MRAGLITVRFQWLEGLLAIALGILSAQIYFSRAPEQHHKSEVVLHAEDGAADMTLRNPNFPETFISSIHIDLTSPHHWVHLTWSGPEASQHEVGPFHSSPGRGRGNNNCDDVQESRRNRSNCTPKGNWTVEGFSDRMPTVRECKFVTWFKIAREIGFHSHASVPDSPASHGCVRLSEYAAQLIHNNSRAGTTKVVVDGTWSHQQPE
jgi:hypothetical protein